jgi:putative peptidoglycan lipid II flippase
VSAVLTVATVALALLTVIGLIAAPLIFAVYGSEDGLADAGVPLLRLFFPQMLFYGWMALGSAVLNAKRRFAVPAFLPVLNNIVVCAALVAFGLRVGGDADLSAVTQDTTALWLLGAGTTAGIIAMTLPLWPAIRRAGVHVRWRFQPRHPAVTTVVRRGGWTLGYVAANQLGLAIMLAVANRTTEGLPSWYTYAFIFFQLPHGLIAVSVMTTFVPELASAWNAGDLGHYRARFEQGLRLVWVGIVPATVVLAMGAPVLVAGLLQRGAFDSGAAEGTADVLATMALGLPGFSAYLFALRGFYALGDTRTPFLVNVLENGMQVVLTLLLVPDADNPAVALGIAYAIAYSVAAVVGLGLLHRRVGGLDLGGIFGAAGKLLAAGAAAVAAVAGVRAALGDGTEPLVEAVAVAVAGAIGFGVAALLLGIEEIRQLVDAVARRRRSS